MVEKTPAKVADGLQQPTAGSARSQEWNVKGVPLGKLH